MKTLRTLVLTGLTVMLFVGVGGVDAAEGGGKVLRRTYSARIISLDPATCGDTTSVYLQGHIFEGLYNYHYLKRPAKIIPQLAKGMPKVSADGLTWTIKLKKNVKYARNACFGLNKKGRKKTRRVKAEDFVLAFKRVADRHVARNLAWSIIGGRIEGLEEFRRKTRRYKSTDMTRYDLKVSGLQAIDDLTLQIKLTRPFPRLTQILAMHILAPIPREAVDHWLLKSRRSIFTSPRQLVGTGPFILQKWRPMSQIILVRNPDFREQRYPSQGAKGDAQAGLLKDAGKIIPFIDKIQLDYASDGAKVWQSFLTEQIDSTGIPSEIFSKVVTAKLKLRKEFSDRGIVLGSNVSPSVYWICFNMSDPILAGSKSLRQAMCLSFNVEQYIKEMFSGRGKRATNCVWSGFAEHAQAGPGKYYRLDLKLAKKKMQAARKELAAEGLLYAGNIPILTLEMAGQSPSARRQGKLIKQQFAAIGLKIKVVYNNWAELQRKVYYKKAQMFTMGWVADYGDVENFLQLFYSPNIQRGTNNTNYSNPEFDKLYRKIAFEPDSPQRQKRCTKLIRIISEDCPVLMLSEPTLIMLRHKWIKNVKPHPFAHGTSRYLRIENASRPE